MCSPCHDLVVPVADAQERELVVCVQGPDDALGLGREVRD